MGDITTSIPDNVTTVSQLNGARIREIDFVNRFAQNWDALREIMGIMRPIRKNPGTKLVSYRVEIDGGLQGGTSVGEGEVIPYSKPKVTPVAYDDIEIAKYARAVTIEAVNKYGAEIAVQRSDNAFLNAIDNKILGDFYTFLRSGELIVGESTWKRALSMAKGNVLEKFASMDLNVTEVIGFANILDLYDYLGDATITMQTKFGITYIKDFLDYNTLIFLPEKYIPRNTVIAVPTDNIVLYYIDPSDADFEMLDLDYTVSGETNLIGAHVGGNYGRAMGEMHAIYGMKLWAEYIDGICVAVVDSTPTLGTLTVTSEAGTAVGDTAITVTQSLSTGNSYKYKVATTAPTVTYGQVLGSGWTAWNGTDDITAATGKGITIAEVDGNNRAQAAGSATVTAKA